MPSADDIIKELWDHAYRTFEKRPGDGFRTGFATKQSVNEVQFRMMKDIATLREASSRQDWPTLTDKILGDILLSEATGWMTVETSGRMQDLLEQLRSL